MCSPVPPCETVTYMIATHRVRGLEIVSDHILAPPGPGVRGAGSQAPCCFRG